MVEGTYRESYWKSHTHKNLEIRAEDGSFTARNSDINWENFELTESLCSETELRFGSCEASVVKFQIRNAFIPLAGKWLTVSETIDGVEGEPFAYGRYKVSSDVPTADKEYRDIVAYDSMHDILEADVTEWYNETMPDGKTMPLKQFRQKFAQHFGISEYVPSIELANDNMVVERTISPEQISGKDVLTAICEINGCFGHIGRNGKLWYIYLPQMIQGLYPANDLYPNHAPDYLPYQQKTGHLYPQTPKGEKAGPKGTYIGCRYEDYICKPIDKIQIRQEENDIGRIWPDGAAAETDNCYIIEDNFLVCGKSTEELTEVARNIYAEIANVVYRPFSAEVVGNPCFEVGDPVRLSTKYTIVESYILQRTLKGIQGKQDTFSALGVERYAEKLNGVHKSIVQLKAKSNILSRTIEETKLEMQNSDEGLLNTIALTAEEIRSEVSKADEKLSTRVTQNANGISVEIERAKSAENGLLAEIKANESEIATKVAKGDVVSEINQTSEMIRLKAKQLRIEGDNFRVDENGVYVSGSGRFTDSFYVSVPSGKYIDDSWNISFEYGEAFLGGVNADLGEHSRYYPYLKMNKSDVELNAPATLNLSATDSVYIQGRNGKTCVQGEAYFTNRPIIPAHDGGTATTGSAVSMVGNTHILSHDWILFADTYFFVTIVDADAYWSTYYNK